MSSVRCSTVLNSVDKQLPLIDVLHLVQEQIFEIPVYLVEGIKHVVEIFCLQSFQTVVIEIGVCEFDVVLMDELFAQCGFAASPDAYHDPGEIAGQRELFFLLSRTQL